MVLTLLTSNCIQHELQYTTTLPYVTCKNPCKLRLNLQNLEANLQILLILFLEGFPNIFSVLQKLIPGLAELTSNKRLRMAEHIIANLSHILIVTNSAVNIIVYAMKVWMGWTIDWTKDFSSNLFLFRISNFAMFYGLGSAELQLSVNPRDIIIPQRRFPLQKHASWRYIQGVPRKGPLVPQSG